jgi:hypothetical protein
MHEIRTSSEEEFERLRERIALEASNAADHLYLLRGLDESRVEYDREMNESNTFWYLTFIAHRNSVLSHLCRLYDKDSAALSLGRFLLTVKANSPLFSETAFRERLKHNPHVDTLADARTIDESELAKELASVSDKDPLVSRLLDLRNTVISHTAADEVRKGADQVWLPIQDIETLLGRARAITSKYSLLYRASMYGGIAGADDYKATLRCVRKALKSHPAEAERKRG